MHLGNRGVNPRSLFFPLSFLKCKGGKKEHLCRPFLGTWFTLLCPSISTCMTEERALGVLQKKHFFLLMLSQMLKPKQYVQIVILRNNVYSKHQFIIISVALLALCLYQLEFSQRLGGTVFARVYFRLNLYHKGIKTDNFSTFLTFIKSLKMLWASNFIHTLANVL